MTFYCQFTAECDGKKFWRSVRIWQSYGKKSSGTFCSGHGVCY